MLQYLLPTLLAHPVQSRCVWTRSLTIRGIPRSPPDAPLVALSNGAAAKASRLGIGAEGCLDRSPV